MLAGFFAKATRVETGLTIGDNIGFGYVGSDPSTGGGTEAPEGSILIQVPAGKRPVTWEKYGAGNTLWKRIGRTVEIAADPTANNDNVDTAGGGVLFSRGDIWINTGDDGIFICKDNTATAAIWIELPPVDNPFFTGTVTVGTSAVAGNVNIVAKQGAELAPAITQALWTGGAGWTINDGLGTATRGVSAVTTLVPTIPIVPNITKDYVVEFTISGWTAGYITCTLGGVVSTLLSGNQVVHLHYSPFTTGNLIFTPDANFAGVITLVSVKEMSDGVLDVLNEINFHDSRGHPRRLAHMAQHLSEEQMDTLLDKSCSALTCVGGVLTYTLYAIFGKGTFNFNGIVYPNEVNSASVVLTGGTDLAPVINYVYFRLVGNTPTMTASAIYPTEVHIDVATFIIGAVAGVNYTSYAYSRNRYEIDSFVKRVIQRFEESGTLYIDGFLPTVTAVALSIAVGNFMNGIFKMTAGNAVTAAGGFFYINAAGQFVRCTLLSELNVYANGVALGGTHRQNIVWGVVPTTITVGGTVATTVRLVACLQSEPTVVYTTDAQVRQDLYDATNYFPPLSVLKNVFVPVCRTIVRPSTPAFITFDTGIYYKDCRGKITSGGGASASVPTVGILDGNIVGIDSASVADNEYARFTANGLESRSVSEVIGDIGAVDITSAQTIDGVKTFEHPPLIFPQVGDIGQAGGWVFYVDEANNKVYECAPSDQSAGIAWITGGDSQTELIGTTGTAVGTGKDNTDKMAADDGYTGGAAKVCLDLVVGAYSDWFLPSKDELDAIYDNLYVAGIGGFGTDFYWSSSESEAAKAWDQRFLDGSQNSVAKAITVCYVRAVRSYSLSAYPSEVATLPMQIVEAGDADYTISDGNTPLTVIFRGLTADRSCFAPTLAANQNREIMVIVASITTAGKKATIVLEGAELANGYHSNIDITEVGGWWKLIGTATEWRGITDGNSTKIETSTTTADSMTTVINVWDDVSVNGGANPLTITLGIGRWKLYAHGRQYIYDSDLQAHTDSYFGLGVTSGNNAPDIVTDGKENTYVVTNTLYGGNYSRNIIDFEYIVTSGTKTIYMKAMASSNEETLTTNAMYGESLNPMFIRAWRVS